MSVLVAKVDQSPWPEMGDHRCDGGDDDHESEWVVWTEEDTGDGMRFACEDHLGAWVVAVWDRIDGRGEDHDYDSG